MDADQDPNRAASRGGPGRTPPPGGRPPEATMGGTVEPVKRPRAPADPEAALDPLGPAGKGVKTPAPALTPVPGERYELRDPFAEVTYRAESLADITARADRLGSNRFVAVAKDGLRTTVEKVDGTWTRGETRAALRPVPAEAVQDQGADRGLDRGFDIKSRAGARPTAGARDATDAVAKPATPDRTIQKAIAKVDARLDARAERDALVARLQAALTERYIIKRAPVSVGDVSLGRTEYRFRGDTTRVAFTASTFRLATDTNSPSVARSMVDVAEARQWKSLRVSGNEDFKRMVWLEASARGVKTLGYEPNPGDLELLKKEREARLLNRIEPTRDAGGAGPTAGTTTAVSGAEKGAGRGGGRGGGQKTVLAAIEAVLVAKKVPEKQRTAIMAAATEKLAQRMRAGQAPQVKVYDAAAPSQRPAMVSTPEAQRTRERAAPAPVR